MGLGDTAKKITDLTKKAESIYVLAKELQAKVTAIKEELDVMRHSMKTLDEEMVEQGRDIEEQRKLLTAVAEQQGIDVNEVLSETENNADTTESTIQWASSPEQPGDSNTEKEQEETDVDSESEVESESESEPEVDYELAADRNDDSTANVGPPTGDDRSSDDTGGKSSVFRSE